MNRVPWWKCHLTTRFLSLSQSGYLVNGLMLSLLNLRNECPSSAMPMEGERLEDAVPFHLQPRHVPCHRYHGGFSAYTEEELASVASAIKELAFRHQD